MHLDRIPEALQHLSSEAVSDIRTTVSPSGTAKRSDLAELTGFLCVLSCFIVFCAVPSLHVHCLVFSVHVRTTQVSSLNMMMEARLPRVHQDHRVSFTLAVLYLDGDGDDVRTCSPSMLTEFRLTRRGK